jgi:hypothetical protein
MDNGRMMLSLSPSGGVAKRSGGSLSSTSQGVVHIPSLRFETQTSTATQASIISSNKSNVHLDRGAELILERY